MYGNQQKVETVYRKQFKQRRIIGRVIRDKHGNAKGIHTHLYISHQPELCSKQAIEIFMINYSMRSRRRWNVYLLFFWASYGLQRLT